MKISRVLTVMFCVVAIVALYGCGGSSQLAESPTAQDEWLEAAQVRISATGGEPFTTSSDASKLFFTDDPFTGTGTFDGQGLADGVTMTCEYMWPTLVDLSEAAEPTAPILLKDTTLAETCVGERNCCLVTLSGEDNPCSIVLACLVDPGGDIEAANIAIKAALNNTGIRSEFVLYQNMTTNMQSMSGVVATVINGDQLDDGVIDDNSVETDFSAIDIDRGPHTNVNGIPADVGTCDYAYDASGNFVVDDDSLTWAGLLDTANDGDILDQENYAWNVDHILAVGTDSSDPASFAACEMIYQNMYVTVDLSDVASGGSTVESVSITGAGRVCNDDDYTNCEGDAMGDFSLHGEDGIVDFPIVP